MTTGFSKHAGVWRGAVAALALSGASLAFAHGSHKTCLSGVEVSAGSDAGNGVTAGVTFVGIDNRPQEDGGPSPAACDRWTTNSNGGAWTATIDRVGHAGIGGNVTVVGGRWFWLNDADRFHAGRVLGGWVVWPKVLEEDIGCGPGVAQFNITLSVQSLFQNQSGTFIGCLDDTHLDITRQPFVFPPHIWGALDLN